MKGETEISLTLQRLYYSSNCVRIICVRAAVLCKYSHHVG
jgi:hypothetical protein